jgi:hypothetical protein
MDKQTVSQLDNFIKVAAKDGMESAIKKHGEGIDVRELEALKGLSATELKQLAELHEKIASSAGKSQVAGLAGDWACGAIC